MSRELMPTDLRSKGAEAQQLRYMRLAENLAGIGTWYFDSIRKDLSWSEETSRIYGIPPDTDLRNHNNGFDFLDETDIPRVKTFLREAREGKYSNHIQITITRPDGKRRTILAVGAPDLNEQGEVIGVYGIIRDITERLRRETELARMKERLELAVDAGGQGIWEWDIKTDELWFSDRMKEIMGLENRQDVITGKAFWSLTEHMPECRRIEGLFQQLAAGEIEHVQDVQYIRPAQNVDRYVSIRAIRRTDENGETQKLIGALTDITAQKEAEEMLILKERRYRDLTTTIPGMVFQWEEGQDAEGAEENCGFSWVSPRVREMLNLAPEDLVADYTHLPLHPDDAIRFRKSLKHAAEKGTEWSLEGRFLLDQEQILWWRGMARPMRGEAGRLTLTGIIIDISETKRYQQELEGSQNALQEQARQLAELAQDLSAARNLAEAERLRAEEASASKSRFLAHMSHEIRTPLNAVIGFSEVMKGEFFGPLGSETYRDYADDIHASGTHLLSLINDVLDMSKIEAGKMELHPEKIDPAILLQDCLNLTRGLAQEKDIQLTADIAPHCPWLRADLRGSKQMIINLLSNAIKFTPDSGQVTVVIAPDFKTGELRIQVTDDGIGMTEKEIRTALEPFGQVRAHLAEKHKGSGLGLPLVKSLIELHGGRLELTSTPHEGTTATLIYPQEAVLDTIETTSGLDAATSRG